MGALYSKASVEESVLRGRLKVADGFTWSVYAAGIESARMMAFTAAGDLLISARP